MPPATAVHVDQHALNMAAKLMLLAVGLCLRDRFQRKPKTDLAIARFSRFDTQLAAQCLCFGARATPLAAGASTALVLQGTTVGRIAT